MKSASRKIQIRNPVKANTKHMKPKTKETVICVLSGWNLLRCSTL